MTGIAILVITAITSVSWCYQGVRQSFNPCQDLLTSFMHEVVSAGTVSWSDLEQAIESGLSTGPHATVTEAVTWRTLNALLNESASPRAEVVDWVRAQNRAQLAQQSQRQFREQATLYAGQKMVFHRLDHQAFSEISAWSMRPGREFELMSTTVTQGMWGRVMGTSIQWPVDLPKTGFNETELRSFLSRLNKGARMNDPGLQELIPDLQSSDRFRLPWHSELRVIQQALDQMHRPIISLKWLRETTWMRENSKGVVQEVAQLDPVFVLGGEFYDLLGNVEVLALERGGSGEQWPRSVWGGNADSTAICFTGPIERQSVFGAQDCTNGKQLKNRRYLGIRLVRERVPLKR